MINSRSFMVNKGGESTTSGDAFFLTLYVIVGTIIIALGEFKG